MNTASAGLYICISGPSDVPAPVPLLGVTVEATLVGSAIKVELAQRFRNEEARPIEAVYLFPLPVGAAVCAFAAEVDGRRVEGRVEEREKAFEIYDDAMAEGHGAFLMDQERPNIFTLSVGNLKPKSEAVIRLTWVQSLTWEGDALRFTLPTTVSPRYTPTSGVVEVGQPDADKLAVERRDAVPYGLSLRLAVSDAVKRIESPTHPIRTTLGTTDGDAKAVVELSQDAVALDRDVVIIIEPASMKQPSANVATLGGERYVQVAFAPDLEQDDTGAEVIFVVDCSGSMAGDSITEARRALELCIRALDTRDRFDVVRFGSTWTSLFGGARAFDDASLEAGVAYARATDAVLGGTEIFEPLREILQRPLDGRRRQVMLLTDGQVSNEAQVIELAQKHADSARIFAFGIGAGVSEHLVREVARASRGEVEMIAPGERIEPKVLRQFGRVRSPALHDVKVDWGGLEVEQAPRIVPPVFKGDLMTVWAKVAALPTTAGATINVTLSAGERRWTVPVDLERAAAGGPVPQLWGRAAIRDVESDSGRHGSSQQRPGKDERKQQRLIELGKVLGLVSSATSYVAVEVRAEADKTTESATLRHVPIALTNGWGGGGRARAQTRAGQVFRSLGPMIPAAAPPPPQEPSAPKRGSGGIVQKMKSAVARVFPGVRDDNDESDDRAIGMPTPMMEPSSAPSPASRRAWPEAKAEAPKVDGLYGFLLTQSANGSFPVDSVNAFIRDAAAFTALCQQHGEARVVTAIVLALMTRDYADRQAEWRPAADKAQRFVGESIDVSSAI